jgi:hypothetical protein
MNYRLICLIFALFSASVTGIAAASLQNGKNLIATNAELLATLEDVRKHPVHDAEITVWKREDGNLLIVVNGQFPHVLRNPCANRRAL